MIVDDVQVFFRGFDQSEEAVERTTSYNVKIESYLEPDLETIKINQRLKGMIKG